MGVWKVNLAHSAAAHLYGYCVAFQTYVFFVFCFFFFFRATKQIVPLNALGCVSHKPTCTAF